MRQAVYPVQTLRQEYPRRFKRVLTAEVPLFYNYPAMFGIHAASSLLELAFNATLAAFFHALFAWSICFQMKIFIESVEFHVK